MTDLGAILDATTLDDLRPAAASAQRDRCRIDRPGQVVVSDTPPFEEERQWSAIHVDLPCSVPSARTQGNETTQGEVEYALRRRLVRVPPTTAGIERGDRVTITAIGPAASPSLLGKVFTVLSVGTSTRSAALRLDCEEVTP